MKIKKFEFFSPFFAALACYSDDESFFIIGDSDKCIIFIDVQSR